MEVPARYWQFRAQIVGEREYAGMERFLTWARMAPGVESGP